MDSIYANLKIHLESGFADLDLRVERIDFDNEGGLLKEEILDAIEQCDLVVADLTYERPNCYLEVGYHMGFHRRVQADRRWRRLILAARADHQPDLPNRAQSQAKVHFDLGGYDLLYWSDPDDYRVRLMERVGRRAQLLAAHDPAELMEAEDDSPSVASSGGPLATADPVSARSPRLSADTVEGDWFRQHCETAGMSAKLLGYVEMRASVSRGDQPVLRPGELLRVARACARKGESIAYVYSREEFRPRPVTGGIRARIQYPSGGADRFEYWCLSERGEFYDLKSLMEDSVQVEGRAACPRETLWYDMRVYEHLAFLMYIDRLYHALGASDDATVHLSLVHGGLSGRRLDASDSLRSSIVKDQYPAPAEVSQVVVGCQMRLGLLRDPESLAQLVGDLCAPLFEVFDFAEVPTAEINELVGSWFRSHGYREKS